MDDRRFGKLAKLIGNSSNSYTTEGAVPFRAMFGNTAIAIDVAEKPNTVPALDRGPRIWVERRETGLVVLLHRDGMDSPSIRVTMPADENERTVIETELTEHFEIREESL